MIDYFIKFHKKLFLEMHSWLAIHPTAENIIYFFAEIIDIYLVFVAVFLMLYFLYKALLSLSLRNLYQVISQIFLMLCAVGASWLFSFLIKILLNLPRPYLRFPQEVSQLFNYADGMRSFPSGHATLFMSLGVILYLYHKPAGTIFIILAFLISFARVISGVHFPIDIMAGWFIGAGISYCIYKIFNNKVLKK